MTTLTLTLTPGLEARLADEAKRRGTTTEQMALDGLRRVFPADAPVDPDASYPVWSPHDAYDAARVLLRALDDEPKPGR